MAISGARHWSPAVAAFPWCWPAGLTQPTAQTRQCNLQTEIGSASYGRRCWGHGRLCGLQLLVGLPSLPVCLELQPASSSLFPIGFFVRRDVVVACPKDNIDRPRQELSSEALCALPVKTPSNRPGGTIVFFWRTPLKLCVLQYIELSSGDVFFVSP